MHILHQYGKAADLIKSKWQVIEVEGAARLFHSQRETKLIPIEMSSAILTKSRELKLGEAVDMAKGEAAEMSAPGVFIYVTK